MIEIKAASFCISAAPRRSTSSLISLFDLTENS